MKQFDDTYRPLPREVTIKDSPIEGLGLFAFGDIPLFQLINYLLDQHTLNKTLFNYMLIP